MVCFSLVQTCLWEDIFVKGFPEPPRFPFVKEADFLPLAKAKEALPEEADNLALEVEPVPFVKAGPFALLVPFVKELFGFFVFFALCFILFET